LEKLKWESLQELPVSDAELKLELKNRNAFLYKDFYRILDHGYTSQILLLIKLSVIGDSLDWDRLSWNALQSLKDHDVPEEILKHVLEMVSTEYYEESNDILYKVSQEEWGKITAENGFINKKLNGLGIQEFIARWGDLVPEEFKVDLSWLKGMSFINDEKIYYFPQSALELDPKQRFFQLFQAKKKWSREELAPFLQDLGTGKGLDTLLVKWARRIKDGNLYYYVTR
jgi:sister chromatid cohesion protein DCC1